MLDGCASWAIGSDLGMIYLVVCWVAAASSILEIQKIARREVMTPVRPFYRHIVRVLLAILAAFLVWVPSQHRVTPPEVHDIALVALIAVILVARAAAGCKWAREKAPT